ncbi:hypothetical protein, partial [Acrocarpospora corrugata]
MVNLRDRGVALNNRDVAEDRFLDLLLTFSDKDRSRAPRFDEMAESLDQSSDFDLIRPFAESLILEFSGRGWVDIQKGIVNFPDWSFRLRDAGRAAAQQMRERREDSEERRVTARLALLRWLYQKTEAAAAPGGLHRVADFYSSPLVCVWGALLEETHVDQASHWLAGNQLIDIETSWGGQVWAAMLTTKGRDCIEDYGGDIATYKKDTSMKNHGGVTIHGDNYGQAAATNSGNVNQRQEQVDVKKLMPTLDGIRSMADALGLPEDEVAVLRTEIDKIEQEGQAGELDVPQAKTRLQRIKTALGQATIAIGPTFVAAIEAAISSLG